MESATPPCTPQRILLIKLRHHGDVLLMTPTIGVLKRRFPEAEIDVLIYKETTPILSRHPQIHKLWGLHRDLHGWRKLCHLLSLYRHLSARHYDWVIHLSDQWNAALLTHWLHPAEGVGFDYPRRHSPRWTRQFTRLVQMAPSNTLHAVEQNLLALKALGIAVEDPDKQCLMAISPEDKETCRLKLAELGVCGSYIVVHPAARWFFKCWEDDRFATVVQSLADDGWPVILTGAPSEQELSLVASIVSKVHSPRVYSLAGQLSLNSLAALIEGARLFIGVDSAPMHMAAALHTDCVALFGPSKINEWHPWMARHILIRADDYGAAIDPDSIDTQTGQRYLSSIPTEAVLAAVRSMLLQEKAESLVTMNVDLS